MRLSLSSRRPDHRGITLVNLGRLRREQERYGEALQVLADAEVLLGGSTPHYRPHAVLETARVLLAAGDVDGASFQLLQIRGDVAENQEQQAEYHFLEGLIASARGTSPHPAFDAAITATKRSNDPTLLAETLIAVLECALPSAETEESWASHHLLALEEAAARTDARPVAMGVRLMRGAVAERFSPPAATQGLASHLQRQLARGGNAVETALGELLQQLPGAAGAAVFVVGIDAGGRPIVSPIARSSEPREMGIRPYRVAVREFDRRLFREALAAATGNVHEAARQLRLPISTFRYRAIKLGLLKPTPRDS